MFKGTSCSFPQLVFPVCVQRVGEFDHKGRAFEHHLLGDEDLSNWTFKCLMPKVVNWGEGILTF